MSIDMTGATPLSTAAILYAESARSATPITSDLQAALDELAAADPGYGRAQDYYEGTYGEFFASIRVRRAMARTGAAFRFNFARSVVRSVVDRLEIASVSCDQDDADRLLQDMWEDNQLDLEAPALHEKACEFGDAYLIVWPSEADNPHNTDYLGADSDETYEGENAPTLEDTDGDGYVNVDIFYNSPRAVRLFYDPEKPLQKAFAIKRWRLTNTKQVRVDLYYPDRIERYITRPGQLNPAAKDLHPYSDDGQDATITNPFGIIPVFHFRTARPYGRPEHHDFYGAQDAIHKLIVSHMSGVDYQSLPQRYGILSPDADTSEAVNSDEDEFAFGLDTGATSRPGDPQSQLTAEPGAFWQLRGYQSVGQFAEADPKTFLDPLQTYLRMGGQVAVTPMRYLDPTGREVSGESLRQEEAPFVKKVINRQLSFGATWREVFQFALLIAGGGTATTPGRYGNAKVKVQWKSPATVDDLTGWQTVLQKIEAGLPATQAFLEAGYTNDQVEQWFGQDEDDMPIRVDRLARIAGALQQLSAAASAGIFTEPEIRAVVTSLLGEVGISATAEAGGPMWEPPKPAMPAVPPPPPPVEQQPAEPEPPNGKPQ